MSKFYGKYRALVSNIKDPESRGRIKVKCPKVYGDYESPWCLPCSPSAYDDSGFFFIPPKNETVWVEFEEGDSQFPIWTGSWWVPFKSPLSHHDYSEVGDQRIIKTKSGHELSFNDKSGEENVKLKHKSGASIEIKPNGDIILDVSSSKVLLGDSNSSQALARGTSLKNWLDNHTHPISWTNASGSGNSSAPNGSSPDPSTKVFIE